MGGWSFFKVQLMGIFGVFSFSFGVAGWFYGTGDTGLMIIPLISGLLLLNEVRIIVMSEENKDNDKR